jgi:hypothetical protein
MPTKRPRYLITATDPVARALQRAAKQWPGDRSFPARLIVHLIEEGERAIAGGQTEDIERRRKAIQKTSGTLRGVYGDSYLKRLRQDWPD